MKHLTDNEIAKQVSSWVFAPGEVSKTALAKHQKNTKSKLANSSLYVSYQITNGTLEKLVVVDVATSSFEGRRAVCLCFYFSPQMINEHQVIREMKRIKNHFKMANFRLSVTVPEREKKLKKIITKLGAEFRGSKLEGQVEAGIAKTKRFKEENLPEGYRFRSMNFEKDMDAILMLEKKTHRDEPTSIINRVRNAAWADYRRAIEQVAKKRGAFILENNGKLVGFCAQNKQRYLAGQSMIATMTLDPSEKGKGLSKFLYRKVFDDMKKRRVRRYFGYSRTKQVLAYASKLGRKPVLDSYLFSSAQLREAFSRFD